MSEINLISAEQRQMVQSRNIVWGLTVIVGILAMISLTAAAAIYAAYAVGRKQVSQKEALVQSLQNQLTEFSIPEQRQFLIYDRLKTAKEFLSSRPQTGEKLDKLMRVFSVGASVKNIVINKNSEPAEITLTIETYADFSETMKILEEGNFTKVNLLNISRSENGIYQMDLRIIL
jgi:hypothetical protein